MKKLSKLQINSERIIKNEELMTLKGGYGHCLCGCFLIPVAWWGYYSNWQQMADAINSNCAGGDGGCNC